MRSDEQLIQSALADPTFKLRRTAEREGFFFQRYSNLELPKEFRRGFPPVWQFAVLQNKNKPVSSISSAETTAIIAEAMTIIGKLPAYTTEPPPLAFLSEEPSIRLADELGNGKPNVFFLDEPELPRPRAKLAPRFAPLIINLRAVLRDNDSALALSPYTPNIPVRAAWRFFGRRKEIDRILFSPENFIVVGARRIGKTSILYEAQRRFTELGVQAHYINAQNVTDEQQFLNKLLFALAPRDFASLTRRGQLVPERLLTTVLRRLSSGSRVALLIDELGTAITKMQDRAWGLLGILRDFAQTGKIKLVATAYSEFFEMQQRDFGGPWVNLATIMPLSAFSREEIDEIVIEPLTLWGDVAQTTPLQALIRTRVGGHPLFLQYFSQSVFSEIVKKDNSDVIAAARRVLGEGLTRFFSQAVQETFYLVPSSTARFLFLAACMSADTNVPDLETLIITEESIEGILNSAGLNSTMQIRYNLLLELEGVALTQPIDGNHNQQMVIAPLTFRYFKRSGQASLSRMIEKYKGEMLVEARLWADRYTPRQGTR